MSCCLSTSKLIALSTNLKELIFFISALVPNFSPGFLIDILASHLNDPSSIFPSLMPKHLTIECIFLRYATASLADLMSGSDTISINGVPALFKSIALSPSKRSCIDLPASSSKCALVIPIIFSLPSTLILNLPSCTTGSSY